VIRLSASKIATYLLCPRRFRFRYVERVPAPWKPSALAFGSAVHAALEIFHRQRAASASMAPAAVGALFRIEWACELVDEVRFKDDERAEDLVAVGELLVKQYAAANQILDVRAAEVPFEMEIARGITLRGVFDALLMGDRVRELKTAARNYDEGTLSRHIQISAYALAYRTVFGLDAVIEVVALLKQRHPRIAVHEVTRTAEQQSWFVQLVVEVAGAIAAEAFPPNPSWACAGCEFAEPCQATGGSS
jgi:CRISPR/Cas system-associated exonuclease Cas4 (RecB family)